MSFRSNGASWAVLAFFLAGMTAGAQAAAEKVLPGDLTPEEKALLEEMDARIDVLDEMGKSPAQIHEALDEGFGREVAGMSGSPTGLDEQERGQREFRAWMDEKEFGKETPWGAEGPAGLPAQE